MDAKERINFPDPWDQAPTLATELSTVLFAGPVIITCFDRVTTGDSEHRAATIGEEFFRSLVASPW
jgi:hypothetical protein